MFKVVRKTEIRQIESPDWMIAIIHLLLDHDQKIRAIKLVRRISGWGLKEAKFFVDSIQAGDYEIAGTQEPFLVIVRVEFPVHC